MSDAITKKCILDSSHLLTIDENKIENILKMEMAEEIQSENTEKTSENVTNIGENVTDISENVTDISENVEETLKETNLEVTVNWQKKSHIFKVSQDCLFENVYNIT